MNILNEKIRILQVQIEMEKKKENPDKNIINDLHKELKNYLSLREVIV